MQLSLHISTHSLSHTHADDRELTSNMQTRNSLLVLKLKSVLLGVRAHNLDVAELQIHESLVAAGKHLCALLDFFSDHWFALHIAVHARTYTNGTDGEGDVLQGVALGRSLGRVFTEALKVQKSVAVLENWGICQLLVPVWQAARA